MKTKGIILIFVVLLFNSCIIKSLQPFYTKESLSFNEKLLGNWEDNKNGKWSVESIKDKFEQDQKDGVELSKEDLLILDTFKNGYFIEFIKESKGASFIAMPFKIKNQYFLDLIPIEIEEEEINSLAAQHLLKTHSVAKLDFTADEAVSLSWLSEERIKDLFNSQKLRLKHETTGFDQDLLLTASSEELYAFLNKYMLSDIEDKWKKEDMLNLTKTDAKP